MDVAAQLRTAGLSEAAERLEAATTYSATSGWEWLGELAVGVSEIRKRFCVPQPIAASLDRILRVARSRRPYGT